MNAMKDRRPLTPEEKAAARRLKLIYVKRKAELRAEGRKLTQEMIAGEFGWSGQTAVAQYLNANVPLNLAAAAKFAKFFNVSVAEISPELADELPDAKLEESNTSEAPSSKGEVPLVSWVQAGAWQEVVDLYAVGDAERWVLCAATHGSRTFALRVRGESMRNPSAGKWSFDDGDIIFVDPDRPAENKSLVVVRINGDTEATFKQLIIEGDEKYLKALNPSWPNQIMPMPKDSVIAGVIISKTVIDY